MYKMQVREHVLRASVAGLMIEKYLAGEIKRFWIEDYALRGEFIY